VNFCHSTINQIKSEFLTWQKMAYVITKSTEANLVERGKMSGTSGWWNKYVFMTEYQEAGCSRGWMQQLETNVGGHVARRHAGTCSWRNEDERRR